MLDIGGGRSMGEGARLGPADCVWVSWRDRKGARKGEPDGVSAFTAGWGSEASTGGSTSILIPEEGLLGGDSLWDT